MTRRIPKIRTQVLKRLFRRQSGAPARYYVYISDAKVDMLYEQVPQHLLSRFASEVKVDLKVIGVTVRQADRSPPVRAAKLAIVERYIENQFTIGTIEEPGSYFRGRMVMQWGYLGWGASEATTVFFLGHEGTETVALGGSRKHVLGETPSSHTASADSATPNLMVAIADHITGDPRWAELVREERQNPGYPSEETAAVHDPPEASLTAVRQLRIDSPAQVVEFLARNLLDGVVGEHYLAPSDPAEERHVTLGTPLYVALAD